MKLVVTPVVPQPVMAAWSKDGKQRRWIWGTETPIQDGRDPRKGDGNWLVSWWDGYGDEDHLIADHCPIERPPQSKVRCVYDGERWLWHVEYTEKAAARWEVAKVKKAALAATKVSK